MTGAPTLVADLRDAVGEAHVLTDPAQRAGYETDWTGRFSGRAVAVVRPANTGQVADVLRVCARHGVGVVPQGGNTGLVGGGVPRDGEVLLSLTRLDRVGEVEPSGPALTVGAGATLAAADRAASTHGLEVGVDMASRDTATIGGMVATNAGGIHVVANGSMRHRLLGLEAVLADGTVLRRMPGLVKDNAGYDLPQLLAGSEGTLAVITAVNLRLVPRPSATTVVLLGCPDIGDLLGRVVAARRVGRVRAAELMRDRGVALVAEHTGARPPFPTTPFLLLLELEGLVPTDALVGLIGDRPAAVAQDRADQRGLWAVREQHTEAINRAGVPVKLDVTLPLERLATFLHDLDDLEPQAVSFGHVADGNLHISLLQHRDGSEDLILSLVADNGGSIASEHGVGIAKAGHLHLTRSAAEIAAMRAIKAALDPAGLLNPGAVLPA